MGPSKILGGCDVRSQEFVPVQSCHISCQLAMSQSESAYSAIADWHWTTSNTPEVAIWAPYGDVGTSQRRSGDVRTWGHVSKIGPRRSDMLWIRESLRLWRSRYWRTRLWVASAASSDIIPAGQYEICMICMSNEHNFNR